MAWFVCACPPMVTELQVTHAPMPSPDRNLIIVHTPRKQALSDFLTVQTKMADRAPDIAVFIVENGAEDAEVRAAAAGLPTVVFSPMGLVAFLPARGRVFAGQAAMTKSEQVRRLAAAGISVPETAAIAPGTRLDPDRCGPVVVVKPEIGKRGDGVRLMRTGDVRFVDPQSWPEDDPRRGQTLIAQRFIDTGPHVASYRVMTVFGRPVYSIVTTQNEERGNLDLSGAAPLDLPWQAIPEVAVHGVDVVREAATRRLYVLEVNPSGQTWHISSDYGSPTRREFNLDLNGQFGALDIIADALIDVTRREAE